MTAEMTLPVVGRQTVTVVFDDHFDRQVEQADWLGRALAGIERGLTRDFLYDQVTGPADQVRYEHDPGVPFLVYVWPFAPISFGFGNRVNPNFLAWCAARASVA